MKVLFYNSRLYEEPFFSKVNMNNYTITYTPQQLNKDTASMSKGYQAISATTRDDVSAKVIDVLNECGVKYITIRAVGYDNIDLQSAADHGIKIANVPDYSPQAIAEHSIAMILALNRKLILANQQVKDHDYTVDKLIGFNLFKKNVGIIGTGKIGSVMAKILSGFGCNIFAYDINPDETLEINYDVKYTTLEKLCRLSDIITIHTPLTEKTKHLINAALISQMKYHVMIINTARGAVVKTEDIVHFLKSGHIGYFGMDVYEYESGIFSINHFGKKVEDPILLELMDMSNVLITPHQAFATSEALDNIAHTTLHNIFCWERNESSENELSPNPELTNKIHA